MAGRSRAKDKARRAKARSAAAAAGPAAGEGTSTETARVPKSKSGVAAPSRGGRGRRGRSAAGRATPARSTQVRSGRHTPPVPKKVRSSPRWMGIAIIATFLVGALVVILDYAALLPGGVNNAWLLAAIAAIFAGLLLATRYH